MENLQVSISSDIIESNFIDTTADNIAITSDVPWSTLPNIIVSSAVSLQTESDTLSDASSQDEQLKITQSSPFIFDEELKFSSTIKNQEQESFTNMVLTTGCDEFELSYLKS